MIFHISVPVKDPERVARVMSELMGGPAVQFVPAGNAFLVFSAYGNGVGIEFVPASTRHTPGKVPGQGLVYAQGPDITSDFTGAHVAMASPLEAEQIIAIGEREGWRALECWRATAFPLVELWVENHFMVEFFPPAMAAKYHEFQTPDNFINYFGMQEVDGLYRMPDGPPPAAAAAR